MKVNWLGVAKFGMAMVGAAIPAIGQVEQIALAIPALRGQDKQDAVVALVQQAILASDEVDHKHLADNPHITAATRAVIDAIVNLHAVTATQAQAAAQASLSALKAPLPVTTGE